MRNAVIFFVLGFIFAWGTAIWFLKSKADEPIIFPPKGMWKNDETAKIMGTIVGDGPEGDRPPNNYHEWMCSRLTMECEVIGINQIGRNQVSVLPSETVPVTEWGSRSITINTRISGEQCNYYVIQADFETEQASYTRMPNNADGTCAMLEQRIYNWRIDDGPFWTRISEETSE